MTLCKWCHQESNRGHKDFQSLLYIPANG